jgi:hypothetical protein
VPLVNPEVLPMSPDSSVNYVSGPYPPLALALGPPPAVCRYASACANV